MTTKEPLKYKLPIAVILALVALLVVAVLVPLATRRPGTPVTAQRTAGISIEDNEFTPAALTVRKGTKVTWTVSGDDDDAYVIVSNPHPTHTDLAGLHSEAIREKGTYSYIFDKVGTFGYHNDLIPTGGGTVKVVE